MALARLAIDTGDGMTTDAVYGWVRQAGRGQVIAIKGVAGFDRSMPVDGPSYVETTEGGPEAPARRASSGRSRARSSSRETYRFLRLTAPTDEDARRGRRLAGGLRAHPARRA